MFTLVDGLLAPVDAELLPHRWLEQLVSPLGDHELLLTHHQLSGTSSTLLFG